MNKRLVWILSVLIIFTMLPVSASAHRGRTDSSGGHRDNKNASGLGYYHYHCGGNPAHLHRNGVCPYRGGSSSSSNGNYNTTKTTYASKVYVKNIPTTAYPGDSTKLVATVYPSNAIDDDITWTSSDTSVATVDEDGNLEATGVGTAVIRAETEYGTASQYTIVVKEMLAKSIKIKDKPKSIKVDKKVKLKVIFQPENTTDKSIKWISEDENIAKVSKNGKLVGIGVGKTTIIAEHKNFKDSFEIEVKPVEAEIIEINVPDEFKTEKITTSKKEYSTLIETKVNLSTLFTPENATDQSVKWSSDLESVATISENGELTCVGVGRTTLTVKHKKLKDSITLTVLPIEAENLKIIVPETAIMEEKKTTDGLDVYRIKKGTELQFSAEFFPSNTTYKELEWKANKNTVIINENGLLEAKRTGKTIITAKTTNGITDSCEIYVYSNTPWIILTIVIVVVFCFIVFYIKKNRKIKLDKPLSQC